MNEFLKMKNTESQEVNRLQQLGALAHYFNNGSKGNKGETFNQHSMRQKNFLLNAFLKGSSVALMALCCIAISACGGEEKKPAVRSNGEQVSMVKAVSSDETSYGGVEDRGSNEKYIAVNEEKQKVAPEEEQVDEVPEPTPKKKPIVKKNDADYDAGMRAYDAGEGLEAISLFKKSGSTKSYYMIGVIYENGCGNVGANPMMARKFFKKAADMGSDEAAAKL